MKGCDRVNAIGWLLAKEKIRPHDLNRSALRDSRQVALQEGVGQRHGLGGRIGMDGDKDYAHDISPPLTGSSQAQGAMP